MSDRNVSLMEDGIIERRFATYVNAEGFLNTQFQFITYSVFGFSLLVLKEFSSIKNPEYYWCLKWAIFTFLISIIFLLNSFYVTVTISKCLYNLLNEAKKNQDNLNSIPVCEYKTLIPWMFKNKWYSELIPIINTLPFHLFKPMPINEYLNYRKLDMDTDVNNLVMDLENNLDNSVYDSSFISRCSLFVGIFLLFIFLSSNIEKYSDAIQSAVK